MPLNKYFSKGLTLLELLLVMVITTGLTIITVTTQKNITKMSQSLTNSLAVNSYSAYLSSILSDSTSCTTSFSDINLAEGEVVPLTRDVVRVNQSESNATLIINSNDIGNPNINSPFSKEYFLSEATLQRKSDTFSTLVLKFQKKSQVGGRIKEFRREINLFTSFDANSTITGCRSDLTNVEEQTIIDTCREITGNPISALSDCTIQAYDVSPCPAGSYLTGFTMNGDIIQKNCQTIDLATNSGANLSFSYNPNGLGNLDAGPNLDGDDLSHLFQPGTPCGTSWNSILNGRTHQRLDNFELGAQISINCN